VRIPIKRYSPNLEAVEAVQMVLTSPDFDCDEPAAVIAKEYSRLLEHHEEETKFLIDEVRRLELLTKD
jgi:hypothetical protein